MARQSGLSESGVAGVMTDWRGKEGKWGLSCEVNINRERLRPALCQQLLGHGFRRPSDQKGHALDFGGSPVL